MKTNELINLGSTFLKHNRILSNKIDSEIILSHILGISRERLLINETEIEQDEVKKFKSLILRRSKNEPVAYIVNNKEFRSKNFFVDKNSLVPRPETELLIDPIIKMFKKKKPYFLEVGLGTGCLTYSILSELNQSRGVAIDVSKETLNNAKKNLKKFKNRIKLLTTSVESLRNTKFDLIVSNPPYIITREIKQLAFDIQKFEPRIALDGGNDGLDVVRKVIYKSKNILKYNGILALEIGTGQYCKVMKILKANSFKKKMLIKDYKNNVRCIFSTLLRKK